MCIRDSFEDVQSADILHLLDVVVELEQPALTDDLLLLRTCLLYTSDAADERSSVDLGGRRIIKKKQDNHIGGST